MPDRGKGKPSGDSGICEIEEWDGAEVFVGTFEVSWVLSGVLRCKLETSDDSLCWNSSLDCVIQSGSGIYGTV